MLLQLWVRDSSAPQWIFHSDPSNGGARSPNGSLDRSHSYQQACVPKLVLTADAVAVVVMNSDCDRRHGSGRRHQLAAERFARASVLRAEFARFALRRA